MMRRNATDASTDAVLGEAMQRLATAWRTFDRSPVAARLI